MSVLLPSQCPLSLSFGEFYFLFLLSHRAHMTHYTLLLLWPIVCTQSERHQRRGSTCTRENTGDCESSKRVSFHLVVVVVILLLLLFWSLRESLVGTFSLVDLLCKLKVESIHFIRCLLACYSFVTGWQYFVDVQGKVLLALTPPAIELNKRQAQSERDASSNTDEQWTYVHNKHSNFPWYFH